MLGVQSIKLCARPGCSQQFQGWELPWGYSRVPARDACLPCSLQFAALIARAPPQGWLCAQCPCMYAPVCVHDRWQAALVGQLPQLFRGRMRRQPSASGVCGGQALKGVSGSGSNAQNRVRHQPD